MSVDEAADKCGIFTWSKLLLWPVWSVPVLNTCYFSSFTPPVLSLVHFMLALGILTVPQTCQAHFHFVLALPSAWNAFPQSIGQPPYFLSVGIERTLLSETFPGHITKMPNTSLPMHFLSFPALLFSSLDLPLLNTLYLLFELYWLLCMSSSIIWAPQGKIFLVFGSLHSWIQTV